MSDSPAEIEPLPTPPPTFNVVVTQEQLLRWAAALTLADSRLSLLYHRGDPAWWRGPGMLERTDLEDGFLKARACSEELGDLLRPLGVGDRAIAAAMDRPAWDVSFWRPS